MKHILLTTLFTILFCLIVLPWIVVLIAKLLDYSRFFYLKYLEDIYDRYLEYIFDKLEL